MLTIYRRHLKTCDHKSDGRKYRRCRCPIWVDGFLGDVEIRKSLELRDWEKAQATIREWEAEGTLTEPGATPITLAQAQEDFLRDAEARGLRQPTLKKYRVMLAQLTAFGEKEGRPFLSQFDLPALRRFRESWIDGGISALKKLERLRAFYRFAHESGWVSENLPKKLGNPKVSSPPTLPFTKDQMVAILAACPKYSGDAQRLRAFTLLLRYSGMRIGDTATCARDRLNGRRLLLYMQKTSEPVFVVLPQFVVDALDSMAPISERYFFWMGEGDRDTVAGNWRRTLRKIFKAAGVKGGHPHRFRDTFAVDLLLAGVPLEQVSILLGHGSIRITEKHYSPWIRDRQAQLEASLERAWAQDPVVLAETKGTPEVHSKRDAVN
jgi:site-specific recombinase XerD